MQILKFEINFVSNRIPYVLINNINNNGSNYFCIYKCNFNDDGMRIFKIEPTSIMVINCKGNVITAISYENKEKIKPIVTIDSLTGHLFYVTKDNGYNICSCDERLNITNHYSKLKKSFFKNYFSKLLVYDKKIFIIYQNVIHPLHNKSTYRKISETIIASSCNDKYIALSLCNQSILLLNIDTLKNEGYINITDTNLDLKSALIYLGKDSVNVYYMNKKFITINISSNLNRKDRPSNHKNFYDFYVIQEINQNFINKYTCDVFADDATKYIGILPFVSDVCFLDDSYEGDILFFGPSMYLPLKKYANDSLYSKLNEYKKDYLFSEKNLSNWLGDYSKDGDIQKLIQNINNLLRNVQLNGFNQQKNELDYLISTIKLPKNVVEESIIQSKRMPNLFGLIIAEIFNTFLNLLIIKALVNEVNNLDEVMKIYSSLYRLIGSDLVKYNCAKNGNESNDVKNKNTKDDDLGENDDSNNNDENDDDDYDDDSENGNNDDSLNSLEIESADNDNTPNKNNPNINNDNNDEDCIQSNLYILNSSFSPLSLREQIFFLYQGNTTFSKLSNSEILKFNSIVCPDVYVEQRILDVARAYLETNEFDNCIEYLNKIDQENEDLCPIQNIYISHLLKQIPDDFESQYKLLKTLSKRLPKNMYKTLYIISLKANHFPDAVNQFPSKDALGNLAREVKKNKELGEYKQIILEVF